MIECYTKNREDDQDYDPSVLDVKSEVLMYIQQIRNIFATEHGMVLGASNMGAELEKLIYETKISAKNLERLILSQIYQYASLSSKFPTTVSVKFAQGKIRDIVFIDITIDESFRLQVRLT